MSMNELELKTTYKKYIQHLDLKQKRLYPWYITEKVIYEMYDKGIITNVTLYEVAGESDYPYNEYEDTNCLLPSDTIGDHNEYHIKYLDLA